MTTELHKIEDAARLAMADFDATERAPAASVAPLAYRVAVAGAILAIAFLLATLG